MKKSLFLLFCLALLASGRAVADVGDTLSYCGNSALQTRVGVNNTTTTKNTDKKGEVNITLNNLKPGTYNITYSFSGTNE